MLDHGLLTAGDIHIPFEWTFADATARAVATNPNTSLAYVTTDLKKLAYQTDTKGIYVLTAITPTWVMIGLQGVTGDVAISTAGVSTVTDLTIASEARGDILYRGATVWQRLAKGTATYVLTMGPNDPAWSAPAASGGVQSLGIHITGVLYASTSVAIGWLRVPKACTISKVMISCATAPTGTDGITVDVHYHATVLASATTIFTTGPGTERPVIAASGFDDDSGAPDVTSLAADSYISFFIDTVGGTIAGADLDIQVVMA